MMNPRFVDSDDTRKSEFWELRARFSKHTEQQCSISSAWKNWGTHIKQTHFFPSSFVKTCWIDILRMCRSSVSFRMGEWQSSSITTDIELMLTSVMTVLGLPPTCSISTDSLLSINALCHLQMVKSCQVSFWETSFNRLIISTFDFLNFT